MTSRSQVAILWRRLDVPGHDACRLENGENGWTLSGTAVFHENGAPAQLTYRLSCDRAWRTKHGRVQGWVGLRSVDFDITRTVNGVWTLNGIDVPNLEHCVDLDFGFTPATNLPQLRRIQLAEGMAADVPVAWLDASTDTLALLPQRYERKSASSYWYQSPSTSYEGLLEVTASGFIRRYPGLWEVEGMDVSDV